VCTGVRRLTSRRAVMNKICMIEVSMLFRNMVTHEYCKKAKAPQQIIKQQRSLMMGAFMKRGTRRN
jgi:hypothetical protein